MRENDLRKEAEKFWYNFAELNSVCYLSNSINRTKSLLIKRGINQKLFSLNFEEEIKGVKFDTET